MMIDAYIQRYKGAGTLGLTDMHILHIEPATVFDKESNKEMNFIDDDVHQVIKNSHFEKVVISTPFGEAQEWYRIGLEEAKEAIKAVKEGRDYIENVNSLVYVRPNIKWREEQSRSFRETIDHFVHGDRMLWYAKMRFGKTLCALEVVRKRGYKKTLILTHRPTVRSGWYEDFHKLPFEGYLYGSKEGKPTNRCDAWVELINGKKVNKYDLAGKDFETLYEGTDPYIYFASMQDLRGSKYIFGTEEKNAKGEQRGFDKNDSVFENDWDLIILDEAHEGTETELGIRVISKLTENRSPKLLYLSGTPYNILYKFDADNGEIFTWDYVMEQDRKNTWNPANGINPYRGLAQMHIYTYDLHDVYAHNRKIYSDEDFFSFSEFFRVYKAGEVIDNQKTPAELDGKFAHEDDVKRFLDLLCDNTIDSYYPFSNDALRSVLKHTFWLLPGVRQVKALEQLINHHPLHTQYGFHVINVAGDGKSLAEVEANDDSGAEINKALEKAEKAEKADLEKVKKGIASYSRTITLSCGRLTTGVTVPEWTGVFMLAGGYKTGAAAYMQTIFRCQSPYVNGDIKHDCYAFDFAPDRTLTVVDEYIKMQPIAKRKQFNNPLPKQQISKEESNANVEATMRLMPVIAMKGGQEIEYDAINFVTNVNRAYTYYFREHGFKGRRLTRDFATFSQADHKLLEEIHKLIGGGKVTFNNDGTLVVASGGLTGENAEGPKPSTNKKGTKTGKDNDIQSKNKKQIDESEQRRRSQNVLDQIYVRLPLLIFGSVEDATSVTIDQLLSESVIDEESWQEFMPKKFTKEIFRQIAHLIKVDALIAYAANIVNEAKDADNLSVEERILTIAQTIARFHFPDKETVLTPWRVVNMHMTETLGGYNFFDEDYTVLLKIPHFVEQDFTKDIFDDDDTKLLEINSKSGVYPLWLAYTLWRYRCERDKITSEEDKRALWANILDRNVFVLCKTPMAVKITRRALAGYDKSLITHCIYQPNLLDILKDDQKKEQLINDLQQFSTWDKNMANKNITFKAVVGNPPYQGEGSAQLYPHFYLLSRELGIYSSLIFPTGWQKPCAPTAKGLARLNKEEIKADNQIVNINVLHNVFQGVSGAAEVNVVFWKKGYDNGLDGEQLLLTDGKDAKTVQLSWDMNALDKPNQIKEMVSLVRKHPNFVSVSTVTSGRSPYGLNTDAFKDAVKNGLAPIVDEQPLRKDDIKIYGKLDGARTERYIRKKYNLPKLKKEINSTIDKYKVFIPYAWGNMSEAAGLGGAYGDILIANPSEICTQTYVVSGCFEHKEDAVKHAKYILTQFARALLYAKKQGRTSAKPTWNDVPVQDFSEPWWNESIEQINEHLMDKYHIPQNVREFVNKHIQPKTEENIRNL